jgi:hypothetical protein
MDQDLEGIDRKLTALLALVATSLSPDVESERKILEALLRCGFGNTEIALILGKTSNAVAVAKSRMGKRPAKNERAAHAE